jgi:hypothetical protein
MISDIQLCSRFIDTLDWICQVLVRHADDFNIALVKIAYGDDNSLGEAYGAPEALRQLSSLTHDLQNSFRKSDLVGREGTDFWILFPYTRVTDNVYDKLMDVLQGSAHNNLNIVQREVAIFELPVIYQKADVKPEDGLALLHYAKTNQAELASHIFRLESVES